jgi:hypothetical protein
MPMAAMPLAMAAAEDDEFGGGPMTRNATQPGTAGLNWRRPEGGHRNRELRSVMKT